MLDKSPKLGWKTQILQLCKITVCQFC